MISNYDHRIAQAICDQIPTMILATLGAHDLRVIEGGLAFMARILPFLKAGERGVRARTMKVEITLNALDYYDIAVWVGGRGEPKLHYHGTDIDCEQLPRILLALDYNGPTVLNAHYA